MRKLLISLALLTAVFALLVAQRHVVMIYAVSFMGTPELLEPSDEGPGVRWHDDYFTVQALDERTFAIGEPRYYQQNFSYLIVGSERAVLFDAGPGLRDIRRVAESLTDRPITFVPSHFHYDHTGNQITFDRVAVVDLPFLRERAPHNELQLEFAEHLGVAEGIEAPVLQIDEWLVPGSHISLGERSLEVLYTPGHTEDSISLLDLGSGQLFAGDFIYPGPLAAFLPNSGMGDYLQGAETLLAASPEEARVFAAHRSGPPGAPQQPLSDVSDLRTSLLAIRAGEKRGEGCYPVSYRVNDRVSLLAEPGWLQRWSARHPELAAKAATAD